jgi:hypothetical protein
MRLYMIMIISKWPTRASALVLFIVYYIDIDIDIIIALT